MGNDTGENTYFTRLQNMKKTRKWLLEQNGKKAVEALKKNAFNAMYVDNIEAARKEILNLIPKGARVGVGGSMTIRQTGVLETLEKQGNVLYDHWKQELSDEEVFKIRKAHLTCDVFLTGANALTLDGMLVSTDGIGNRVGAMIFGPNR